MSSKRFQRIQTDTAGKDDGGRIRQARPALLVAVVLLLLLPRSATEASNLCTSQACIAISAQLLHNLNLSADPCQDFASFACGGFRRREAFGTDTIETGLGVTQNERNKLSKRMFELFTQPELARSVDDVELDQMFNATRDTFLACAGWFNPRLQWLPNSFYASNSSKTQSPESLIEPLVREINKEKSIPEEYLAHLVMTGLSGVLGLLYESSSANEYIFGARQRGPVLTLRATNFHFAGEWNETVAEEIEALCSELKLQPVKCVNSVVEIQNTLFNLDGYDTFVGTFGALQLQSAMLQPRLAFNWTVFVENLQPGLARADLLVIIVGKTNLFKVLHMLVSKHGNNGSVLRDFLRIDAAMALGNILPANKFPALFSSYTYEKSQMNQLAYRTSSELIVQHCVNRTTTVMAPIVYRMFRAAYHDEYSPELIHSLIEDVKKAMKDNVDESSWLGSQSKRFVRTKIDVMRSVLVYHQFSTADLKQIYMPNSLVKRLSTSQQYGEIVLASRTARNRLMLWALTSMSIPWYHIVPMAIYNPFDFNAYYLPPINMLFFPIGMLGSVMYHKDYPRYLQYGGIGSVIGHEIGHAFSPASCYLDKDGQPSNSTLDPESNMTYVDRVGCLSSFYNTLKMTASVRVNGKQTVGENLADIVGINAAFRAYRGSLARSQRFEQQLLPGLSSALSPDQLFFVQAAQVNCEKLTDEAAKNRYMYDEHSPGTPRILGTMSQSREFARVFSCKPGDKMNLPDAGRCPLW